MPNRPLPEVSFARDGPVRWPHRDLQARVAHHSPPWPHAICVEHHRQWGGSQVPPREDRSNRRLQGSSCWHPAPNVLHRLGHRPGLCDYTPAVAHLHRSCDGKESGRCQGHHRQETLWRQRKVSPQWPTLDRHGLGDIWRLHPRDSHHDPQDRHPSRWQAQPTPRTDHLPDQSVPFCRAPTKHWGAADCLQVRRLIAGSTADTSDD